MIQRFVPILRTGWSSLENPQERNLVCILFLKPLPLPASELPTPYLTMLYQISFTHAFIILLESFLIIGGQDFSTADPPGSRTTITKLFNIFLSTLHVLIYS